MLPHQERVVTERKELVEKLNKLNNFIHGKDTSIFDSLPQEDRELLKEQAMWMTNYSNVLAARIDRFTD